MELTGITRIKNGKEVDEFVAYCPDHNYYYNGRPPLTTGCRECWTVYYFCQWAMSDGDKKTNLDQLESAIRHTAESIDKGEWDFKPKFDVKIEKEN